MESTSDQAKSKALIFITWDGRSTPLEYLAMDAEPDFDIGLFDYSGSASDPGGKWRYISEKTQCKGDIFRVVADSIAGEPDLPIYIALFDDDISVSVSGLNRMIAIAMEEGLDCFSPTLTPDSHYSHDQFVTRAGSVSRPVPWIEVMMPVYRTELFLAGADFYRQSTSSWGLDIFVMPLFQKVLGFDNVALIDAVTATHTRPVTSNDRVYANGRTAQQEMDRMRALCLYWLRTNRPDLLGTKWCKDTFFGTKVPRRLRRLRFFWTWQALKKSLMPA